MRYKLIIGSPNDPTIIQNIIDAAASAGAGKIGNYEKCAVVNNIRATWTPTIGASPDDGEIGKTTWADCVWIETECSEKNIKDVYQAVKKIHPYEEPGMQIIKLEEFDFF